MRTESSRSLLGLVVEDQKLVLAQRQLCVGFALVIGELDFKYAGGEVLVDGSDRAAQQALIVRRRRPGAADAGDRLLPSALETVGKAMAYLNRRGIGGEEAINTFKLGFADRTLGLRLPDKQRKAGMEIRTRLERSGCTARRGASTSTAASCSR